MTPIFPTLWTPRPAQRVLLCVSVTACLLSAAGAAAEPPRAISFGGGSCGRLQGGEPVPCNGKNHEAYSSVACVLGRNVLHPLVVATLVDAWKLLEDRAPGRTWQYGELGVAGGGRFWPHKTHQAGVSADLMVPLRNAAGDPVKLPVHPFNALGYGVELDAKGRLGALELDWNALAQLLQALDEAGTAHGVRVRLVIFDTPLKDALLKNVPAARAFASRFNKHKPWIRHDEHVHVEFDLPANAKAPLRCKRR